MTSSADAVIRRLEVLTARHVFGLPGSSSVQIFHSLASSDLELVPAVQEGAAVATSDGYARFAGATAVSLYMLPGVATALGNIYNAWRDESPLLFLVSQQATRFRNGQRSVGEADLARLLAPFGRFTLEVGHAEQLGEAIDEAHRAAVGPPGGPAFVILPEDLLRSGAVAVAPVAERVVSGSAPTDVQPVVEALLTARRPLLVVGGQLRRSGGSGFVEALADELEIPVVYEPFWNDRLGVAPGHRCTVGQLSESSSVARSADAVVALGCRLFNEIHPRPDPWFPASTFVAHINADAPKARAGQGATWSVVADPARAAHLLLRACRERRVDDEVLVGRRERLDQLGTRRRRVRRGPMAEVARALADEMDYAYVVDESVSASQDLVTASRSLRGERYVSTSGGSLGWGVGAACGVTLATSEPVTCVIGDGAFFFGVQALWLVAAEGLPVVIVVIDNGGFGSTEYFEDRYASELADPSRRKAGHLGADFRGLRPSVLEVAAGFGIPGVTVSDPGELRSQIEAARSHGPALIHVPIPS